MEIIDANIVLRYLLNDHETLSKKSTKILENKSIHFPLEVCAEVVYVLEKVYNVPRKDITNSLTMTKKEPFSPKRTVPLLLKTTPNNLSGFTPWGRGKKTGKL